MENHENSPNKRQGQDTIFKAQLQRVLNAFRVKPMTIKELDVYMGIMRENICRHLDNLLEQGRIAVIRKRKCSVTGYPYVNEYTADPNLIPKPNQLILF
ncbi:hypothetical protein [Aestuariivivens sediminicola]|uniref:hypothetical protein n=1 Tax=Aestuariivivens sediminicola TaxID=2913560 RepID=UPI001F56A234|nr:hypothetical protein [Aestuariivivens sediminicola]